MEKIYVIEQSIGCYSDRHDCPFKAFKSYDKAKNECDRLNKEMDDIQSAFDKIEGIDHIEGCINTVKEQIFKDRKPDLFDKWYQIWYSENSYSWNDEAEGIEEEYYEITDEAEKNVNDFISVAAKMDCFSTEDLNNMKSYLVYLNNCEDGNPYDGVPSYYVSKQGIDLIVE